jgi:hypothetical protein
MALSFTVKDGLAILKNGTKIVDQVGPWETDQEAGAWAKAVCDKYNSEEYSDVKYPDELPNEAKVI